MGLNYIAGEGASIKKTKGLTLAFPVRLKYIYQNISQCEFS